MAYLRRERERARRPVGLCLPLDNNAVQDNCRVPLHPFVVVRQCLTQPDQSYDRLLFLTDMKTVKQVLPFGAGIEISSQGNVPRLQFAFLRCQHLIAQSHKRSNNDGERSAWWRYNRAMLDSSVGDDQQAQKEFREALLAPDPLMAYHLTRLAVSSNP